MSIGTPKVPVPKVPVYRDEKKVFVPLNDLIQYDRVLFLCRNLELPLVNQLIGLILVMNSRDDTNIRLLINSEGGAALWAMALYDTMQLSTADIYTIDIGLAASSASLILVGGELFRRVAFPHARIVIHQPSTGYFSGTADDILVEAEKMCELRNKIVEIFAQKTNQPRNVIQKDLERNTFMSAEEAQNYGIIDQIVKTKNR